MTLELQFKILTGVLLILFFGRGAIKSALKDDGAGTGQGNTGQLVKAARTASLFYMLIFGEIILLGILAFLSIVSARLGHAIPFNVLFIIAVVLFIGAPIWLLILYRAQERRNRGGAKGRS